MQYLRHRTSTTVRVVAAVVDAAVDVAAVGVVVVKAEEEAWGGEGEEEEEEDEEAVAGVDVGGERARRLEVTQILLVRALDLWDSFVPPWLVELHYGRKLHYDHNGHFARPHDELG